MEREVRLLLAWMGRDEAIGSLLGHLPEAGQNVSEQAAVWERAQNAMLSRPAFTLATPTLEEVPGELAEQAEAFRRRPDVVSAFRNLDWTVGMVNLESVLGFQKLVAVDGALARASEVGAGDLYALFSFCLPEPRGPVTLTAAMDQDQKGFSFSSLDPNLRIVGPVAQGFNISEAGDGPGQTLTFVGFAVNFGVPFVQVAEYRGRWFLRDGYHRCYGLLQRGIFRVPCVFVRARSFDEVGASRPGFFGHELLSGDHPPFLVDFLDDRVSVSARQRAFRKVVRVSAAEFVVEV